jgi:hypothetical protein
VNREDRQPAPARDAHQHTCGDWCFCWIPADESCESCRRKKASKRMREDYESRRAENQSVGV